MDDFLVKKKNGDGYLLRSGWVMVSEWYGKAIARARGGGRCAHKRKCHLTLT